MKLKFAVWNKATESFDVLKDLSGARAIIDSIGVGLKSANNEGRLLLNPDKDYSQGDEGWTIEDSDGEITLPKAVDGANGQTINFTYGGGSNDVTKASIYYRAGGNSYNFGFD